MKILGKMNAQDYWNKICNPEDSIFFDKNQKKKQYENKIKAWQSLLRKQLKGFYDGLIESKQQKVWMGNFDIKPTQSIYDSEPIKYRKLYRIFVGEDQETLTGDHHFIQSGKYSRRKRMKIWLSNFCDYIKTNLTTIAKIAGIVSTFLAAITFYLLFLT